MFYIVPNSYMGYDALIGSMDTLMTINPRYAVEIRDILMNPPESCTYEIFKSELIKRISSTGTRAGKKTLARA